jgi:hypothetical protein
MRRTAAAPVKSDAVRVGAENAPAERRADRIARAAEQRLGYASRTSASGGRATRNGERAAPASVGSVISSPGERLPPATRDRMQKAFRHDFSHVRVHRGSEASRSAASIGAFAYTVGSHVVMPQPAPAALTHELAHVVEQETGRDDRRIVRRVSPGEAFLRFFGGGTYEIDELKAYLGQLLAPNATIEDKNDSDNKARAVVENKLHQGQPLNVRRLLIDEMLSGVTGDDDEDAILTILKDSEPNEMQRLIELVGRDRLDDKLDGEQNDELKKLFAKVYDIRNDPIPLDWNFAYSIAGAEEFESGPQGVKLKNLGVRAAGAKDPITLATGESITQPGAAETALRTKVPYPRQASGEAFADFQIGTSNEEGEISPVGGGVRQAKAAFQPVDILAKTATVKLDVTMAQEEVGSDTLTNQNTKEASTAKEDFSQQRSSREEVEIKGRTIERKDTTREGQKKGTARERGSEEEQQKEKSQDDTTSKGTQHETGKRTGTEKTDQTEKTEGTETTLSAGGELSGTLTPSLKMELAGELGIGIADLASIVIPFTKLTKGLLGKILGRVAKGLEFLSILGDADKQALNLSLEGGVSFSVTGKLHGEASRKWIDITKTTKGTKEIDEDTTKDVTTEGEQHRKGTAERDVKRQSRKDVQSGERSKERERSVGEQEREEHQTRVGEETTVGKRTTVGKKTGEMTGTEEQSKRLIAVVKDAKLSVTVR